ncbi:MAG: TetR/AcrR family transcriptional regulator [Theionarchaea archaeon]|nr:TetR/AcrR family transcriptional regulator [Theionarchaea archaeon]MBU7001701.1 TetR/AcrR family transcriptional regulator [Theionarchaea archaeon]MBU7021931.1 TetR/AcrR family transcriptional regulator [Theionarchaea archaeon]MBU7035544.1 TetR/AcrR family transcriptional regulator [Theionarchaea archaeon]MBU7040381.1 TetR/AcrR family transcriptional regulator [Theionarchaea archaeon]
MTRVTKNPEIRKEELIEIAEELFAIKGYEETPVSDIVKKAQVAQGTFYYYFKSKDEILDSVVDRLISESAAFIREQSQREDIDAIQKIIASIKMFYQFGTEHKGLISFFHQEKNSLLHIKMEKKTEAAIVPIFADIIKQGVEEGLFDTKYPREASSVIFSCWDRLFDPSGFASTSLESKKQLIVAGFSIIERVLGAQNGSLTRSILEMLEVHHGE